MNTSVPIPAATSGRDGQPELVGDAHAVDGLQDQLQGEAKLHLDHDETVAGTIPYGYDVTPTDLALHAEARCFEKAFHAYEAGVPLAAATMGGREWAMLLALSVLRGGSFLFNGVAVGELASLTAAGQVCTSMVLLLPLAW